MRLSAAQRRSIPKSEFGLPENAPSAGSYPLPDKSHAEAALRLLHNASPDDQVRIKAKIHRMWPSVGKGAKDEQ